MVSRRQCLLNAYTITTCPSCSSSISHPDASGTPQVLVTYTNEGGVQENLDLLPLLSEESYLKAYPEERRARAFLELCREGDLEGVVSILQDTESEEGDSDSDGEEDDEEEEDEVDVKQLSVEELLRYQDPLQENQSALQCAVQAGSREIAWLLLFLASALPLSEFPDEVLRECERRGFVRGAETEGMVDIRGFRDVEGRSAEDVAREVGEVWQEWVGRGWLVV